jgi:hypothetical protein
MDRRMLLGGLAGAMLLASAVALSVGNWHLAVVLLGAFVIWFVRSGTVRR